MRANPGERQYAQQESEAVDDALEQIPSQNGRIPPTVRRRIVDLMRTQDIIACSNTSVMQRGQIQQSYSGA
jgi:hypothetical protein